MHMKSNCNTKRHLLKDETETRRKRRKWSEHLFAFLGLHGIMCSKMTIIVQFPKPILSIDLIFFWSIFIGVENSFLLYLCTSQGKLVVYWFRYKHSACLRKILETHSSLNVNYCCLFIDQHISSVTQNYLNLEMAKKNKNSIIPTRKLTSKIEF